MKKLSAYLLLLASFNASATELKEKNHKVHCTDTKIMFDFLSGPGNKEMPFIVGTFEGGTVVIWHSKERKTATVTWTDPSGKETCLVFEGYNIKVIDKKEI